MSHQKRAADSRAFGNGAAGDQGVCAGRRCVGDCARLVRGATGRAQCWVRFTTRWHSG